MLASLDSVCRLLNRWVEYLLFSLGLSMALLVAVQVFCRYILNSSLFWSEELARYMLVWISFFGAVAGFYHHLHPGVDVVTSRLSPAGRFFCQVAVHGLTILLALAMVISGSQFAWFVRLQISPALGLPKWLVLSVIPLSGMLFLLYAITFLLQTIRDHKP